ncbi:FAD:protein FMN transferase [Marinitenerispora sediminis]|uniref:FAD:protein FMN transferase n=1 Tax=Marinitenerispora sediminis TaxID=1931232 RepID=UPI001314A21D|nr:FAD:protein FMN transferase [Marinitenerispora sediminis]
MSGRAVRDRVMGTDVLVAGLAPAEAVAALGWLREVERVFTRFAPDSDTRRVGAAQGRPVRVAPMFTAVLAAACEFQRRTGGVFDPFLGAEIAALGYDRDFAEIAAGPAPGAGAAPPAPAPASPPRVEIDHDRRLVTLSPGLAVDLGGFVKGWSVQQAADGLRERGVRRGLIDAGGDLVAWRSPADPPWRIGVAHPLRTGPADILALTERVAVATSSVTRRAWRDREGRAAHHVLDPRTGRPAESDCLQATVLATDLAAAEVAATCLVILGTRAGPRQVAELDPSAAWLTVDREGRVRRSANLGDYRAEAVADDTA